MHLRGIYGKSLYRLLTWSAILTALILCIVTGWFLQQQSRSNYSYYLEQAARTQESASAVSSSIIVQSVGDCLKSPELARWADAGSLESFYFHAIDASQRLNTITTDLVQVEYELAATPLNPKAYNGIVTDMVLMPNQSMTSATYCQTHGLTKQQYLQIIDYFHNYEDPLFLPVYHPHTGELTSIQYILKEKRKQNPLLLFVTIPKKSIINDSLASGFFLHNSDRIFAYSDNSQKTADNSAFLYSTLLESGKDTSFRHPKFLDDQYFLVTEIGPLQCHLALWYPPLPLHLERMLLFGLIVFVIIACSLLFARLLSQKLYHPVKELIESAAPPPEQSGAAVDEFAVFRSNLEKITELGTLLNNTIEENNSLLSIQTYKELLFSQHIDPEYLSQFDNPDADYCVAIGETLRSEGDLGFQEISLQKSLAYDASLERDDLIYINLDYNRYALIVRTSSSEHARQVLNQLLRQMETLQGLENSDHRIVLSSIHNGLSQLHTCYQEALRILDFRYLHAKSRLISYEEISSIDAVTYSYPLQMENRLIQCAIDGKEEAIVIFENMIRENIRDKDLSKETLQNLIYAFIGTISRIFQEMKTVPEDFLGRKIDYRYLYNHWNDSAVFIEIKEILEEIIQTVKEKESSQDHELLEKMLHYIYENYQKDIMLIDLADYLNISPKYCGILFKQLSDNNFKDFLNRYRIEKSKEILSENPAIKIVDLSAMVGFNSSNSFIRVFNKYVGISPKAYQDRIRNQ